MNGKSAPDLVVAIVFLAVLLAAAPASAVREGQIALAAQIGLAHPTGGLEDTVRDNVAFGAVIAYGIFDWLAVEVNGFYGVHGERDRAASGDVRLDLGHLSAGPRFTYGWRMVDLWVSAGIGAVVWKARVEFPVGDETEKEENTGAVPSLSCATGVDFRVSDNFQVGVLGHLSAGLDEMEFGSPAGDERVVPLTVFPALRAALAF